MKKKMMIVFGTRPEAIKMAPIIKAIEKDARFESCIVVTVQHREMLDQVLKTFAIKTDYDLNIMTPNQTLATITSRSIALLDDVFDQEKPDMVLVHGDTTTTFAAALTAFYHQVPVGHVEAGLRTYDKYSPFPEEMNRQMTDALADLYFAPTSLSRDNLLKAHHDPEHIYVTGNSVIDALAYTVTTDFSHDALTESDTKKILITMHRRENLGQNMVQVFQAMNQILDKHQDIELIFPMHKNPKIRELVQRYLVPSDRLHLIEPLDVFAFHNLAKRCYLILTDSGGIQEEAPSLGVPVFVLRDATERPEGVAAGTLKVVGTEQAALVQAVDALLTDPVAYEKMASAKNPYGDGKTSDRIVSIIAQYFGLSNTVLPEFDDEIDKKRRGTQHEKKSVD